MKTKIEFTDEQMNELGNQLAKALHMKKDRNTDHSDRWATEWGTKTGKGLLLTIASMMENIEESSSFHNAMEHVTKK